MKSLSLWSLADIFPLQDYRQVVNTPSNSLRLLRLLRSSWSNKVKLAFNRGSNRKVNIEEISMMYRVVLNECFQNGFQEPVLKDKNVSFTGCRPQSRDFPRYVNSRMGTGDPPCKTKAPFSCDICVEFHMKH